MSCETPCPLGPTHSDPLDIINTPNTAGNTNAPIPLKIGEPLSTSCERATIVGSIPEVIRFPGFTTVNGAIAYPSRVSSGGICNLTSFFRNHNGCYENENNRLASSCC